jgi:hypothetical protein
MKKILIALTLLIFVYGNTAAQSAEETLVNFKLKNSSLLPKKVTIVSYQPGDSGNGTEQITMLPKASKQLTYRTGTRIYVATSEQVGRVMSGKRIDEDKPFLVVKKGRCW